MDSNISRTKENIDMLRRWVKKYKPYDENDPEYNKYDGDCDDDRVAATMAKKSLIRMGLNPYDENDYGDIID